MINYNFYFSISSFKTLKLFEFKHITDNIFWSVQIISTKAFIIYLNKESIEIFTRNIIREPKMGRDIE